MWRTWWTSRKQRQEAWKLEQRRQALESLSDQDVRQQWIGLEEENELAHLVVAGEVARRTLGWSPYPSQWNAAKAMLEGCSLDMAMGEGKTLVMLMVGLVWSRLSTVHVITSNDYLAKRDAERAQRMTDFLGLEHPGTLSLAQDKPTKRHQFNRSWVFGTLESLSHVYLKIRRESWDLTCFKDGAKPWQNVIVDEVDQVILDMGLGRMVWSVPGELWSERQQDDVRGWLTWSASLPASAFSLDRKRKRVELTEEGEGRLETRLKQWSSPMQSNDHETEADVYHLAQLALQAQWLVREDVDYVMHENKVVMLDPITHRMAPHRRWQGGLHEWLSVKHGCEVEPSPKVVEETSVLHFLQSYARAVGMSGTAWEARQDLEEVLNSKVVRVPPRHASRRRDEVSGLCGSLESKRKAILNEVESMREQGRPVLIGTWDIEEAERLHQEAQERGWGSRLLTAKDHHEEAQVLLEAGAPSALTIVAGLAGRGVHIPLGGPGEEEKEKVIQAGGLHVIVASRNANERADEQLRARCARQGEPGSTRTYSSTEDRLLKEVFEQEMGKLLQWAGWRSDSEVYKASWDKPLRKAQGMMEQRHRLEQKRSWEWLGFKHACRNWVLAMQHGAEVWLVDVERRKAYESLLLEEWEAFDERLEGLRRQSQWRHLGGESPRHWLNHRMHEAFGEMREKILVHEKAFQEKEENLG